MICAPTASQPPRRGRSASTTRTQLPAMSAKALSSARSMRGNAQTTTELGTSPSGVSFCRCPFVPLLPIHSMPPFFFSDMCKKCFQKAVVCVDCEKSFCTDCGASEKCPICKDVDGDAGLARPAGASWKKPINTTVSPLPTL